MQNYPFARKHTSSVLFSARKTTTTIPSDHMNHFCNDHPPDPASDRAKAVIELADRVLGRGAESPSQQSCLEHNSSLRLSAEKLCRCMLLIERQLALCEQLFYRWQPAQDSKLGIQFWKRGRAGRVIPVPVIWKRPGGRWAKGEASKFYPVEISASELTRRVKTHGAFGEHSERVRAVAELAAKLFKARRVVAQSIANLQRSADALSRVHLEIEGPVRDAWLAEMDRLAPIIKGDDGQDEDGG